jgi:hypothetical protein
MRITFQFHATRSEIYAFITSWAEEHKLNVVGELFFPEYRALLLPADGLASVLPKFEFSRISLHLDRPEVSVDTALAFVDANPDALSVLIGRVRDGMIFESILGATTSNAEAGKLWRRLRRAAKESMSKGSWVENKLSNARSRDDSHAYTQGVRNLQDHGMEIMGQTDQIRYILD